MGIPSTYFIPTKIPLDFSKKLEALYKQRIVDIKSKKITLNPRALYLNILTLFLIQRGGVLFLWRLTAAVLCKKRVFEVLISKGLHFIGIKVAHNQNSNIFKIGSSEKSSFLFIMQIVMLYSWENHKTD